MLLEAPPNVDTSVSSASPAVHLDRDSVRGRVAAHLEAGGSVEELGIEPNRPPDTTDFAFVGRAAKRQSHAQWYRCSFCQTDRKFSGGRIVLSSDKLLRLIGDDCWDRHLDSERYHREKEDLRDYERKQEFIRIRERLLPIVLALATELRDCLRASIQIIAFVDKLPTMTRQAAPPIFSILERTKRQGGALQVDRSSRDYSAMAQSGIDRFILQPQTIHIVMGLDSVIGPPPQIENSLRGALRLLHGVKHEISETNWDDVGNTKAAKIVNSIIKNTREAASNIDKARDAVGKACDFFGASNLIGIVRWGADSDCDLIHDGTKVLRHANGLKIRDAGSDTRGRKF